MLCQTLRVASQASTREVQRRTHRRRKSLQDGVISHGLVNANWSSTLTNKTVTRRRDECRRTVPSLEDFIVEVLYGLAEPHPDHQEAGEANHEAQQPDPCRRTVHTGLVHRCSELRAEFSAERGERKEDEKYDGEGERDGDEGRGCCCWGVDNRRS